MILVPKYTDIISNIDKDMQERKSKVACISLPRTIMSELDEKRGDVPRSIYLLRLIEKDLNKNV